MKLLCIGFDGLDFVEWKTRLAANFPDYSYCRLHSPYPASGPAWTSIQTGMTPDQHGVTNLWGLNDGESRTHADVEPDCVWNKLETSCAICNVPIAFPPSDVRPFMVSGFMQPLDSVFWSPARLSVPGSFREWSDLVWVSGRDGLENWATRTEAMGYEHVLQLADEGSAQVARWFLANGAQQAEFGWIAFTFPDRLLHAFGPRVKDFVTQEAASKCYERRDALYLRFLELIWRLINFLDAQVRPDAVLIMSDHGFDHWGTSHTQDGILAWRGMDLSEREYTNWDVAHIIARQFGKTLPEPGVYTGPEKQVVEDRLRDLGYMEG